MSGPGAKFGNPRGKRGVWSAVAIACALLLSPALGLRAEDAATEKAGEAAERSSVHWLTVNGVITQGTSEYIARGIAQAEDAGAQAVIIELDTPGGLVSSTREIVKSQLNATIPVVVWVGPRGARAGSAGVFITLAGNVAAMAPGTNIGAAHPIGIGPVDFAPSDEDEDEDGKEKQEKEKEKDSEKEKDGEKPAAGKESDGDEKNERKFKFRSDQEHLARKLENDTIAWAEAIARERGRNVEWARDAVLNSVSIVAQEALDRKVIDLIAKDREALLEKIEGMTVKTADGETTIRAADAAVDEHPMSIREKIVSFIADPTVLSILGMIVSLGLLAEFYNPGLIVPAVVAGIALLFLLVGMQAVPVNVFALLLIALGFACFVLEVHVSSFGFLTVAGAASAVTGLSLIVDQRVFTVGIAWNVVLPALAATIGIMAAISWLAYRALTSPTLGDSGEMVGRVVRVAVPLAPEGTVMVDGTYWKAVSETPVLEGGAVRIVRASGLTLHVVPEPAPAIAGGDAGPGKIPAV